MPVTQGIIVAFHNSGIFPFGKLRFRNAWLISTVMMWIIACIASLLVICSAANTDGKPKDLTARKWKQRNESSETQCGKHLPIRQINRIIKDAFFCSNVPIRDRESRCPRPAEKREEKLTDVYHRLTTRHRQSQHLSHL